MHDHEKEQSQGSQLGRLLISLGGLASLMFVFVLTGAAIYQLIVYLAFGFTPSWSGRPPELDAYPRLVYLFGICVLIGGLIASKLWKRLFFASGYVSQETQQELDKGYWPLIGGYWKPVGYVLYIGIFVYMTWLGYEQYGWAAAALTSIVVFLYLYLAWKDLLGFIRDSRARNAGLPRT